MRRTESSGPRVLCADTALPADLIDRLRGMLRFHDEAVAAYAVRVQAPLVSPDPQSVVVIHTDGDPRAMMDDCDRCVRNIVGHASHISVVPMYAGDDLLYQTSLAAIPFYCR